MPVDRAIGMTMPPVAFTTRTFSFACQIVTLYQALNRVAGFPFALSRQLLRAGTSIGANIEEARNASSRKDLASRFLVALREARETRYWLRLIEATSLAPPALLRDPLQEINEIVAILTTSVRRLRDG